MPSLRAVQLEIAVLLGTRIYARCLLGPGDHHLGHDRRNDISIDEPSISARHARLTIREDGAVYLIDAGSANGTFVDDEPALEALRVVRGARIQVGACSVEVREMAAA